MYNDPPSSQSSQGDKRSLASSRAMSSEALARRRMLLKGLGKGSAALAVVVPIQTLAATTIIGGTKLCTVSGVHSNIGSHNATGQQSECSGYQPSHYAMLANWPGYSSPPATTSNTVGSITFTENDYFATVFGGGSTGNNAAKLLTIVQTGSPASEQVWVTALLNAIKNPIGFNFPYTPQQVLDFYNSPQAAQALLFFQGYMQTVA